MIFFTDISNTDLAKVGSKQPKFSYQTSHRINRTFLPTQGMTKTM
jgi:hypothetical protein